MASISPLLLKYLDELGPADFDTFKFSLKRDLPQGFDSIPGGKLADANKLKVVELMVNKYNDSDAAHITVHVLKQIDKNKLATDLEKELRDKMPGGNKSKPISSDMAKTVHQAKPTEIDEYKMSSNPGFCLIINNMDFGNPKKYRHGSNYDAEELTNVFQWLGFTVEVYTDKTAGEMKELLRAFGQKQHDGDCFVCCILSHGSPDGVLGTDNNTVFRDDIFSPFYGINCTSLIEKPKVFFIQACRGKQRHPVVQTDNYMEESPGAENEEEGELATDAEHIILNEADFLIARATVKGYYSMRRNVMGTWFIQSLCRHLKTYCPGGTDINFILIKTNDEVSRKVGCIKENNVYVSVAQMPSYKSTLRKSLVFRPVKN